MESPPLGKYAETFTASLAVLGGDVAWSCVALATLTWLASCVPKVIWAVDSKFCPAKDVDVPPTGRPSEGWATGAAAKDGTAERRVPGLAASTKLTPRFAMPKTPAGRPVTATCTVPLKPFWTVTEMVTGELLPPWGRARKSTRE
jgi:hypothetical protein